MCNMDCWNCKYDDCIRDERQDQRDRDKVLYQKNKKHIREIQKARYWNNVVSCREYQRLKAMEYYDTAKNTTKCKAWREKNADAKREYDRQRYLERKEQNGKSTIL